MSDHELPDVLADDGVDWPEPADDPDDEPDEPGARDR